MTYFYTGDIPAAALIVSPSLNGEPITLQPLDEVVVLMTDPSGDEITTLTATVDEQDIEVAFPTVSVFTETGIYTLTVVIDHSPNAGGEGIQQADPIRLVVDDSSSQWATLALARDQWVDSRAIDDPILHDLLQLAQDQVIEYAPVLADTAPVPLRYRLAQVAQAKNVYNGSLVDSGSGDIGSDTFQIRPFPLDWQIKQMLRPRRGKPVVT